MDGSNTINWTDATLTDALSVCRKAYLADGFVSADMRRDRLSRAIRLLFDNKLEIAEAISEDFGHRNHETTMMSDIAGSLKSLKAARKDVHKWMQPKKAKLQFPLGLLGVKGTIEPQPKGVVGIIAPWNYPIGMIFQPLAGALAAGNRVMVKPSEHTPKMAELLERLFAKYFDASEICCITGGPDTSAAFSNLPLDHMFFTGATSIGKMVMGAAAKNLTPVTLELGGKSPVIVGASADMDAMTTKIAAGKHMNAGQTCVAPDYVMIDKARKEIFAESFAKTTAEMYPKMLDNDDYSSVVNARHRERIESYLDDARTKGADVRVINPADEDFSGQNKSNKMPPAVVLDATDDMKVMQEEIFGPLLIVRTTDTVDDAINYVNQHDRPLSLYYFGSDKAEETKVLTNTTAGGVAVNEVIMHMAHESMPFGGVGASGMGNYHGEYGFNTFSHTKSILRNPPKISVGSLIGMVPPFGKKIAATIAREVKA